MILIVQLVNNIYLFLYVDIYIQHLESIYNNIEWNNIETLFLYKYFTAIKK